MNKKMLFAACALLLALQACDTSGSSTVYYQINYVASGAQWGAAPAPGLFLPGSMARVADNTGNMGRSDGKVFVGWRDSPSGGTAYSVGRRFPINGAITLYAQWAEVPSLNTRKTFYTLDLVDNSWYGVSAVKLAEGVHCIIYADVYAFLTIDQSWGTAIVDKYEDTTNGIYKKITAVFKNTTHPDKTIEDMDGNNKVIFLLLDIQDGYAGTGGYVAGYFHPYHMYASSTNPYSNQADMLFMDINPGKPSPPESAAGKVFYSTMAHELQHLINWSITKDIGRSTVETWLDEGLAAAAEYVYGDESADRVNYFNSDPYDTILYGNNFFYWSGAWDNDVLADYSTAYLFFRWLGIHGGGNGIYTNIINSSYSDYRAVTTNAAAIATGIDAGASAEAAKWQALLSGWMRANITHHASNYFGYKGAVTPAPAAGYFDGTNHNRIEFYPGEGIFSRGNTGSTVGSGANIRYIDNIPVTGETFTALLTYNGSTNEKGNYEYGFLANTVEGVPSGRGAASIRAAGSAEPAASLPATYPIGFRDVAGERGLNGKRSGKGGVK
ncbi:MAG: hypothetical protein LBQ55_10925 [Treponema sp.]|jgi:hypothetical protein|nr:hypothetical protein [Treponema sp.]